MQEPATVCSQGEGPTTKCEANIAAFGALDGVNLCLSLWPTLLRDAQCSNWACASLFALARTPPATVNTAFVAGGVLLRICEAMTTFPGENQPVPVNEIEGYVA